MPTLLCPEELDQRLRWPLGKAARLARQRRLPHVLLPDGSIRFIWEDVRRFMLKIPPTTERKDHEQPKD